MEAVGKGAAAADQTVQVWRLDFGIAERMNPAIRQIISDQEEKTRRLGGTGGRGTRESR